MILEIFLLLLTVYIISIILKPKPNLPPGPWGLPIFGSIPHETQEACLKARKKYGDLYMQKVGAANFVYICDFKLAKESFSKLELADRPNFDCLRGFREEKKEGKNKGVIFSNGEHWHHNRRFLLRHLRDLGMGKSKIEGIMLREAENLVEDFKLLTKEPSTLPFSLNVAVLNIIWQLVSSQRYDFSDKQVKDYMDKINRAQEVSILLALPDFFPILKYIFPRRVLDYILGQKTFDEACSDFENIVQPVIDEHVKNLDPNNPCDLMDDYLIEMKHKKSKEYSHFSYGDLTKITFDIFTAGNDTTANMIRWVLLFMAKYPKIQKKIQQIIDSVVSKDILPGLEHRESLAYLDATINEVQRMSSMLTFGVMRSTMSDVTLNGYFVPKGTIVRSVAVLSHNDPAYWKNPEEFDPSRFLDANGRYIVTCDGFQAFGLGKRQCLGEQFARMELYLVVAGLLQNFTFAPPDGEEIDITPHVVPSFNFPRKDQKFNIRNRH